MANSAEELLQNLKSGKPFDLIVLDDSFDAKSPDGEALTQDPTVAEILQEIQAGYSSSPDATIVCFLRTVKLHDDPGTVSIFVDSSPQEREQTYTELGATFFVEKPYSIESIKATLAAAVKAAASPETWSKALQQVRQLYNKNNHADVLRLLDKLAAANVENKHLGFPLLRARCLAAMGSEHIAASVRVLEQLLVVYPKSVSIRMLLLDNHIKLGSFEKAFKEQLSIFATQKTSCHFDKVLSIMSDIHQRMLNTEDASTAAADAFLIRSTHEIIAVLFKDARPYSKKLRVRIFDLLHSKLKETAGWIEFVKVMRSSDDVIDLSAPLMKSALAKVTPALPHSEDGFDAIFEQSHRLLLSVLPTEAASIEVATKVLIAREEIDTLDEILKKAEANGAKSVEFFTSLSRYCLHVGDLKGASDVLHKAVRIQADDPRVLELRQLWQQQYDSKNKTAT